MRCKQCVHPANLENWWVINVANEFIFINIDTAEIWPEKIGAEAHAELSERIINIDTIIRASGVEAAEEVEDHRWPQWLPLAVWESLTQAM